MTYLVILIPAPGMPTKTITPTASAPLSDGFPKLRHPAESRTPVAFCLAMGPIVLRSRSTKDKPMTNVEAGKWYFFVTCKNEDCKRQIAFADAPAPEDVLGPVTVNHGPLPIHCNRCGADRDYTPEEFLIRQAANVH